MTNPRIDSPPLLEQLGAVGSLLIHDMANQVCIISGNATFAQMMLADPQQVGRAVEAIAKSAEHISHMLGQCAELRRRLGAELPTGDGVAVAEGVEELIAARPGWTLALAEELTGDLVIPSSWFTFATRQVLAETGSAEGQARLRRVRPGDDASMAPAADQLELRLKWTSPRGMMIEELRQRYENFGLLASFELIRQCGGKLDGFSPGPNRQEALICVPYVIGPAARQTAAGRG